MKRCFFFSVLAVLLLGLISCQKTETATVIGKVNLPDGTVAYLRDLSLESADYVDTAKVEKGLVTFSKQLPAGLYGVEAQMNFWPVLVGTQTFSFDATVAPVTYQGEGADLFNAYSKIEEDYNKILLPLKDRLATLEQTELTEETKEEIANLSTQVEQKTAELKDKMYELLKQYPNNLYSLNLSQMLELTGDRLNDFEAWLNTWKSEFAENGLMKQVRQYIDTESKLQRNKPFVDFAAKDKDGNEVKLSELAGKGKPVILEIWASWCKACRQGMPHLIELYNKYKDKGLQIYCVSMDQAVDQWQDAVKNDALPWDTNYICTEFMASTSPLRLYNSMSMPVTVLLDGQGKIVDRNNPEDLDKRLDMIFSMPEGAEVQWE